MDTHRAGHGETETRTKKALTRATQINLHAKGLSGAELWPEENGPQCKQESSPGRVCGSGSQPCACSNNVTRLCT